MFLTGGGSKMTLQATKTHLIQLLAEPENRVIAFSGKWGTGKSHMWRELKEASNDSSVKNALYVSLFGLGDMSQVKLKIVQAAIPNAEANPGFWDGVMTGVTGIRKALEGFHKGFSGLSEFALLAVPAILRNKMIVLDDIERKHQNLSIDEVLGFIDEFTQQYGARFVLILNSDQLENKTIWDTLHEKVVDQEIRLDTSPSEAFDIAIGLTPSTYGARIKEPVEVCRLTNIRIIRKVIRAVNRILGARKTLSDAVLMRVIPSTVLLAAINYKGIENGPDFNFVLNCGSSTDWEDWEKKEEELDEGGKRRAKWRLLMKELGIMISDDYELIVIEYLRSGLFDDRAVSEIIDRYVAEDKAMEARELARQFQDHAIWHYKLTKSELLAEAKELGEVAHLLDPYSVTSVHKLLSEIQGC